jgi:hypothetical protein
MKEQVPRINQNNESLYIKGQKISIENSEGISTEYEIINILDSQKAINAIGINYNIKKPVDILILDKGMVWNLAAYHPELNVIFADNNTSPDVMHHEIIHSLEMTKPVSDELKAFYNKVLEILPDESNLNPNYRKDIHEFIADAYSKKGFVETLKVKDLYDEFLNLTKYIFE